MKKIIKEDPRCIKFSSSDRVSGSCRCRAGTEPAEAFLLRVNTNRSVHGDFC